MARETTKRITSIGGQALIEGIMMRGPKRTEISVRMPDGTISSETLETGGLAKSIRFSASRFSGGLQRLSIRFPPDLKR